MVFTQAGVMPYHHFTEIAFDATMKQIPEQQHCDNKFNKRLANVFYKYRDVLDASYNLLLAESRDLDELIQFAPGFFVMMSFEFIPDVAMVLDIDETSFLDLLERNRHFVDFLHLKDHASPHVRLNLHVRDFLTDRNRSIGHHHNPRPHHLAICFNYSRLSFDHPWLEDRKRFFITMGRPGNRQYRPHQFDEHLCASDVEPSEEILVDDPIWSFLDHLHQIVYYHPAFDSDPDPRQIGHISALVLAILRWVQRHQEVGSAHCPS